MKKFMALLLVLIASPVWAAPTITGVTGTIEDGGSVSLAVTSPGTGSTIVSWDNFESHTTGTGISGKTPIVGPNWSLYRLAPATDDINISTTRAHGGDKSVMIEWTDETINSFGWANQGPYSQLYITWWGYQQFAGSITTSNRKWFYLYGNNTAGCYDISAGSQSPQFMPLIPSGNTVWGAYNNQSASQGSWSDTNNTGTSTNYGTGNPIYWSGTSNRWGRWEYWQKLNTSPTCTIGSNCDGEITYWYDAVKRYERTNYKHSFCTGEWRDFRLGHMWQGHIDNATYAFIDDLFIATSQARVELGDASTFDNCTHREIQRHTAWGTTITFAVNTGTFTPGATAYLFVVDENGDASNGYPITIGGTSSDTTAPTVSGYSPAQSATDVPVDTDISFIVSDAGDGVSVNGIYAYIEGANHCCSQSTATCVGAGTKDLTCTGSVSAITVTKSGNTFDNSQTVDVDIYASDLAGNSMTGVSYSFETTAESSEEDTTNPVVTITSPTTVAYYYTDDGATTFSGTASDNVRLASVDWANSQGGSGTASGTADWSVDVLPLTASTFGSTLVSNGLFNADYASWDGNNDITSQGTNGDRANSLSIADDGVWSERYQTITVENGELYLIEGLSYSVSSDLPENGSILIDLAGDRTDTWGDAQIVGSGVPNTWQTLAGVVQAEGTSMTIRLHSEGAYTAYFDSISVRKVTGANVITVTATDTSSNTSTDTLTIVYSPPAPPASAPARVMVQDAAGKTWVYDANGVRLLNE